MDSQFLSEYKYNGARSMVLLHERYLISFLETWKKAKGKNIALPVTDDTDYESLETLLSHIFRSARGYMVWMCDKLNLPDPNINEIPKVEQIENEADDYLKHLINQWKLPLTEIVFKKFNTPTSQCNRIC